MENDQSSACFMNISGTPSHSQSLALDHTSVEDNTLISHFPYTSDPVGLDDYVVDSGSVATNALMPRPNEDGNTVNSGPDHLDMIRTLVILIAFSSWDWRSDLLRDALGYQSILARCLREDGMGEKSLTNDQDWHNWIVIEGARRVNMIAFAYLNVQTTAYNFPPVMLNNEVELRLPCSAVEWDALDAKEWQLVRDRLQYPQIGFQDAVGMLLDKVRSPEQHHLLSRLSPLVNFILLQALVQRICLIRQLSSPAGTALRDADLEEMNLPVNMGIQYVSRSQMFFWSCQHSLSGLESAVFLSKWLQSVAATVSDNPLTGMLLYLSLLATDIDAKTVVAHETNILDWIRALVEETFPHQQQAKNMADSQLLNLSTPPACIAVSKEVSQVQRLLKKSGLVYHMHSAGTTVEGPWDDVMRVIGQAHSLLHENGVVRIQSDIRVGSRTDKKQTAEDKVAAVNAILDKDE
ncbi:hypothetical protein E4T47_03485 [Aureobasidium subglaciale]|nr:hypothetical protein E4T47_03485 [Aureobasidium subglaciale]